MAYEQILYEVGDHLATLTLNRPSRLNAWTPMMESEVRDALTRADADDSVRVIILTGAGRGFCAGADMQNLDAVAGDPEVVRKLEQRLAAEAPNAQRTDIRTDFQKTYS